MNGKMKQNSLLYVGKLGWLWIWIYSGIYFIYSHILFNFGTISHRIYSNIYIILVIEYIQSKNHYCVRSLGMELKWLDISVSLQFDIDHCGLRFRLVEYRIEWNKINGFIVWDIYCFIYKIFYILCTYIIKFRSISIG